MERVGATSSSNARYSQAVEFNLDLRAKPSWFKGAIFDGERSSDHVNDRARNASHDDQQRKGGATHSLYASRPERISRTEACRSGLDMMDLWSPSMIVT